MASSNKLPYGASNIGNSRFLQQSAADAMKQLQANHIAQQKYAMQKQMQKQGLQGSVINIPMSNGMITSGNIYGIPTSKQKATKKPKRSFKNNECVELIDQPDQGKGIVEDYDPDDKSYFVSFDNTGRGDWYEEKYLKKYVAPKPKAPVTFESVIIADHKRKQIIEALEQINQGDLIFDKWGFDETIEKGKGVSLLFYGEPGTGKTLMGQAIAHKLDKKLAIIGTADIESSAPGESERNIRKHFDEAKKDGKILLFDECDSLIYTRTNVGPILGAQINELLSQIERFDGVTIFTTNRLGTLDEAVNRRLALKLEFSMPSHKERIQIWQRMIPKKAPVDDDVDWERLAIIELAGGFIKNAVLRAARMAATEPVKDKDKRITMQHLLDAIRLETESMIAFQDARDKDKRGMGRAGFPGGGNIVRTIG